MPLEYGFVIVRSPEKCLEFCNLDPDCKFWEYGNDECRRLKSIGNGLKQDLAYAHGQKRCVIGIIFI